MYKLLIITRPTSYNAITSVIVEFSSENDAEIAYNRIMTARTNCIIDVIKLY